MGQAGLRINVVPREGGNTFRGTVSSNFTGGDGWNAYNLSDELSDTRDHVGEPDPPCVRLQPGVWRTHQAGSSFWFLTTGRWLGVTKTATDTFYDGDPDPYRYAPDPSRDGYDDSRQTSFLNRLTWGVTEHEQGHRLHRQADEVHRPHCRELDERAGGVVVPVSALSVGGQCEMDVHAEPTAAVRGRVGASTTWNGITCNQADVPMTAFRITDQTTGRTFGAPGSQQRNISSLHSYTAKLSWVTGTHTLSGGLNGSLGSYRRHHHARQRRRLRDAIRATSAWALRAPMPPVTVRTGSPSTFPPTTSTRSTATTDSG